MNESNPKLGPYYIGVDVGTSSVRAAVVDASGRIISFSSEDIRIWQPSESLYEQSSDDIWNCLCSAVRKACSKVNTSDVRGIGFDATCSLVVLDQDAHPISVTPHQSTDRNIILWLDHRAISEAEIINASHHDVLKYVGGKISPEMQAPKILWLKKNLKPENWERISIFLDLPEFLTFKATGCISRSLCSVVCKFNYMGHSSQEIDGTTGWIPSFWKSIGLGEFVDGNFERLGKNVYSPGAPIGHGLSMKASEDLGLPLGLAVATSLIDAHAGGLGIIGSSIEGTKLPCEAITSRLAIICGTSSCHMAISEDPLFVDGVWGPYYSAMVPGFWLNEGGQSATGKLIDHVIESHPAWKILKDNSQKSKRTIYEELHAVLHEVASAQSLKHFALLTKDYHIYPDFHGNRSPIADPTLTGMITGLSLSKDITSLAVLYLATIQALANGTKQILNRLNSSGHDIEAIFVCGGLSKNAVFIQCHADVTGLAVVLPRETDSVLIGSAILGAFAAGDFKHFKDAMSSMSSVGHIIYPMEELKRYYEGKYKVFEKMLQDQIEYRKIMK